MKWHFARQVCGVGGVRAVSTRPNLSPLVVDDVIPPHNKPAEFYETCASKREYFFYIDLNGRLFAEDTRPKNITSCLKDARFLDFFWRNLQLNKTNMHEDYPLFSPCGKERNFVVAADTGIVFSSLEGSDLSYAGTLRVPFHPSKLLISSIGRLYHPTFTQLGLGLLRSHLALEISQHLTIHENGDSVLTWNEKSFVIRSFEHEDAQARFSTENNSQT